jgi:hypothetical protein
MQSLESKNIINYNEKYLKYKYKYLLLNQSVNKLSQNKKNSAPVRRKPLQHQNSSDKIPKRVIKPTSPKPINPLDVLPTSPNAISQKPKWKREMPLRMFNPQSWMFPMNHIEMKKLQGYKSDQDDISEVTQLENQLDQGILLCPQNIRRRGGDVFNILLEINNDPEMKSYEKILVVPANAAQPWGDVGSKIYVDFYIWLWLNITNRESTSFTDDLKEWMNTNVKFNNARQIHSRKEWLELYSNIFLQYSELSKDTTLEDNYKKWITCVINKLDAYSKFPLHNIKYIKELIYIYRLFMSNKNIKIFFNIGPPIRGLEEQIMNKWIDADDAIQEKIKIPHKGKLMYPSWGLYLFNKSTLYNPEKLSKMTKSDITKMAKLEKLSPLTIQNIDYTDSPKYNKKYIYKARLKINETLMDITLLFIFTPNFYNGISRQSKLVNQPFQAIMEKSANNNISYKRNALYNVFKTIFDSGRTKEEKKCYVLPHLGSNITSCHLVANRDTEENKIRDNNQFFNLVKQALMSINNHSIVHVVVDSTDKKETSI